MTHLGRFDPGPASNTVTVRATGYTDTEPGNDAVTRAPVARVMLPIVRR